MLLKSKLIKENLSVWRHIESIVLKSDHSSDIRVLSIKT